VIRETRQYRKDGTLVDIEVAANWILDGDGTPVGIHGVSRDITERKLAERERARLEAQLMQAQKIETVGRLAGGVAHDFNNLLTGITGNLSIALEELRPEDHKPCPTPRTNLRPRSGRSWTRKRRSGSKSLGPAVHDGAHSAEVKDAGSGEWSGGD
jgi:signal transduction histidine kinase